MPSDSIIKDPLETNKYLLIYSIPILFTTSFIPELIQAFVVGDFGKKDLYRACVCIKPLIIRKKKSSGGNLRCPQGQQIYYNLCASPAFLISPSNSLHYPPQDINKGVIPISLIRPTPISIPYSFIQNRLNQRVPMAKN